MLRRIIWSPLLVVLVGCASVGGAFYSPVAHIKKLVDSGEFVEASVVYDFNKESIDRGRPKTQETIDFLAAGLARHFAPDIERALDTLEGLHWPQGTDQWKSTGESLSAGETTIRKVSEHSLLVEEYPSLTKLSALEEQYRKKRGIIEKGMYVAFLSYPLDSGPNFFDIYPVEVDAESFLAKHEQSLLDKIASLDSSGCMGFVATYKSQLPPTVRRQLSQRILETRTQELADAGEPTGVCSLMALLDLMGRSWAPVGDCSDPIGVLVTADDNEDNPFSLTVGADVPCTTLVSQQDVSDSKISTDASRHLLVICDVGATWTQVEVSGEETVKSEFVSGNRVETNPDYTDAKFKADEASMRLQRAQISASTQQKSGNALADAVGSIAGAVVVKKARDEYEAAMLALRNTPMTVDIPVYSRYSYTLRHSTVSKNCIAYLYLVDPGSGSINWSRVELTDFREFSIADGLHDQDRNYGRTISMTDDEADVEQYVHGEYAASLSGLLRLALDTLTQVQYSDGVLASLINKNRKEAGSRKLMAVKSPPASVSEGSRAVSDGRPVLSVLDFEIRNMSAAEGQMIVDLMTSALLTTGRFRMIDRGQRDSILKEIEFSYSDCTDVQCQIEIGRLLAAERIVVGSVGRAGDRFLLTAKLLDVTSGEMLSSAYKVYASLNELVDGCEELSFQLVNVGG